MKTPSATDRELLKLRTAKLSTKSIAMLMGGRWTEARVYNRLAELDGQVEATLPDLPLHHRVDEDLPEDPEPAQQPDASAFVSGCRPGKIDDRAFQAEYLVRPESWAFSGLRVGAFGPAETFNANVAATARFAPMFFAGEAKPLLVITPSSERPDAREVADQPPSVAVAAQAAQPADEPTPADAGGPDQAQADGDQAPEAEDPDEGPALAPNPLALEARPFVPVHKAGRRRPPAAVVPTAPNLLAPPAPSPKRQSALGGALRLRPLTDKIIGYAQRYWAANWPIDEIAELFDVSADQLEKVLA